MWIHRNHGSNVLTLYLQVVHLDSKLKAAVNTLAMEHWLLMKDLMMDMILTKKEL